MPNFLYRINDISSKYYIINNEYIIESKYSLDNESLKSLNNIKNNIINNDAYIYGEVVTKDDIDHQINLLNISHIIKDIDINLCHIRKLKLKKLKGEEIKELYNVIIKIIILDTNNGKFIKSLMIENIKIKTYLSCLKDDINNIKIITENISY
jgi:hypothetical protein